MNHNRLLAWTLMIGLPPSLLLVPGMLAQSLDKNSVEMAPPSAPLLLPGNPTINPISNTHTAPATTSAFMSYD